MAWIADTYKALAQNPGEAFAVVTGKPLTLHGIPGRVEATGRGVFYGLRQLFDDADTLAPTGLTPGLAGKRVVVQGLGNVGSHAALLLAREGGCTIVGVAERDGGLVDPDGLDIEAVVAYQEEHGVVEGFPGAEFCADSASLLELDCDILVPAALEGVITAANAAAIRARVIAEAANGPTHPDADQILRDRGVLVLPDVYLNAGGVVVSYFEWLKNRSHVSFERISKRYQESASRRWLDAFERTTGPTFSQADRTALVVTLDREALPRRPGSLRNVLARGLKVGEKNGVVLPALQKGKGTTDDGVQLLNAKIRVVTKRQEDGFLKRERPLVTACPSLHSS